MGQYSSYYLYQKYEKRGNQDWIPCVPNVYSISGDSTTPMSLSAKSECDPQCGCSNVEYRWVNLNPSTDWICDGTSKYYKQRREMSYDEGTTWIPLDEYRKGDLIEASSSDCTAPAVYRWVKTDDTICVENSNSTYTKYYVYKKQQQVNGQWVDVFPAETKPDGEPIGTYGTIESCEGLFSGKFRATYTGGTTYEIPCDGNPTLTSGDTTPTGYTKYYMTDAVIGDCVTSIDRDDFFAFYSLTSVTIPNSLTSIGNNAFYACTGLTSVVIPNSVTSIGKQAFAVCYSLSSCTIGNGVTSIGEHAFGTCSGLTSIVIPSSVTSIEEGVFNSCFSLTSVTMPNSVTTIGILAFSGCHALTSITIPNSVTIIEQLAFNWCYRLKNITIGTGITSIGYNAFYGNTGATSITCLATTPPTLEQAPSSYGSHYPFDNTNNAPIYVPSQSVNSYKSSWSMYSSRIQAIPNS